MEKAIVKGAIIIAISILLSTCLYVWSNRFYITNNFQTTAYIIDRFTGEYSFVVAGERKY